MACHFPENIHTKSFTPREYQVELIDAAKSRNVVVCLDPSANKTLIVLKVLQELSNDIRVPWTCGGKKSLYLGNEATVTYYAQIFSHLTDLNTKTFLSPDEEIDFVNDQVLLTTYEICSLWLSRGVIEWNRINLLLIEDCHYLLSYHSLREVVVHLNGYSSDRPRILGLTIPLFSSCEVEPGCVQAKIRKLESELDCEVDTASDIVSVLRYNAHPKELIVVSGDPQPCSLSRLLENEVEEVYSFIRDHRYDPSEIYEESFKDELEDVPDPKKEPSDILDDFLEVLHTMGPWCANKAAFVLLVHVEKMKVRTPYERHYLLLCLVSTLLLRIRAICDDHFEPLSEVDKIKNYSSPKILRLIEIVRQLKPRVPANFDSKAQNKSFETAERDVNESIGNISTADVDGDTNVIDPSKSPVHFEKDLKVSDECPNASVSSTVTKDAVALPNGNHIAGNELDSVDSSNSLVNGTVALEKYRISNPTHSMTCFICGKINCSGKIKSKPQVESGELDLETGEIKAVDDECKLERRNTGAEGDTNSDESTAVTGNKLPNVEGSLTENLVNGETHNGVSHNAALHKISPNMVTAQGSGAHPGRPGRWRNRGRGWKHRRGGGAVGGGGPAASKPPRAQQIDDADNLCGVIFVRKKFTAKILYHLFYELNKNDIDFKYISTQYTVGKSADPLTDPRDAENEYRKQEDVLKRFRMRECNLVVATSVLEEGIELPRCNLVVRFDPPIDYRSHAHSKGRARQQNSYYIILVESLNVEKFLRTYAKHVCTEEILLGRCVRDEPSSREEVEADLYNKLVPEVKPLPGDSDPSVTLSNSIALVNRYCAKLPSDTFTRLAPIWSTKEILCRGSSMFFTSIRLPINSPVKETIMGYPMPNRVLAKRMAALETCRRLHSRGELDNNLEPIGKEAFNFGIEEDDLTPANWDPNVPRPGTTKSRQYYYKKIADCLNNCRPNAGEPSILYNISMTLTCPLPEEQNTRGRKLHPPELAPQAFGILTRKPIPKICPFPIFTRSGEVQVSLQKCSSNVMLTERHVETISAFLNFTFTSVLRLQKYLMSFDPQATENSFYIVPTRKGKSLFSMKTLQNMNGIFALYSADPESGSIQVDWEFLELIYEKKNDDPRIVSEEERKKFVFNPDKYQDAVVMPWYRNQDQPQYFYVAEICHHLSPKSAFPGSDYNTFEDYYLKKYHIQIQDTSQPLLDVDHTSARLNFLTPRYVNRKGVALPTSSEETKKAKRENLEQKQILVAELCLVHVVPASLWRQAVCLPCILYRINALLLADEIRTTVARCIGLGLSSLPPEFEWPPLDFGWSLADVLMKSKEESMKNTTLLAIENGDAEDEKEVVDEKWKAIEDKAHCETNDDELPKEDGDCEDKEKERGRGGEEEDAGWMEIGTWSNEMAQKFEELDNDLPGNLSMVRYGSPTSWPMRRGSCEELMTYYSDVETDDSSDYESSSEASESSSNSEAMGLKITFKGDYLAEAVEQDVEFTVSTKEPVVSGNWTWDCEDVIDELKEEIVEETKIFQYRSDQVMDHIQTNGMIIRQTEEFVADKANSHANAALQNQSTGEDSEVKLDFKFEGYVMPEDISPALPPLIAPTSAVIPYNALVKSCKDACESNGFGNFSFDVQPDLDDHPGPSPALLLQALTMSNANDGINLERLETIGDSFLKYAITTYLYCTHENIHEGKLSHLRSKQVQEWLGRTLDPTEWGWQIIDTNLVPVRTTLPPAPDSLLLLVACDCKSSCGPRCGCRRSGQLYSEMCSTCAQDCSNSMQHIDADTEDPDVPDL